MVHVKIHHAVHHITIKAVLVTWEAVKRDWPSVTLAVVIEVV